MLHKMGYEVCPICDKPVKEEDIPENAEECLDCQSWVDRRTELRHQMNTDFARGKRYSIQEQFKHDRKLASHEISSSAGKV